MQVRIYVTSIGTQIFWDEPKLAVKNHVTDLPPNPHGKDWLFFVDTTYDDELIANQPFDIFAAFGDSDYFIFD